MDLGTLFCFLEYDRPYGTNFYNKDVRSLAPEDLSPTREQVRLSQKS